MGFYPAAEPGSVRWENLLFDFSAPIPPFSICARVSLALARDRIRRNIQVRPLVDVTGNPADVGQPYPVQPYPDNPVINQAINEAIDIVNSVVRVGAISVIQIGVTPATQPGPYWVDFSSAVPDVSDVSEAVNVDWKSATGSKLLRLEEYDYYAFARHYVPADQLLPANNPVQWFQTGTQIAITPPPNQAGILYITQQEGLPYLCIDTDDLNPYLPINYDRCVWYLATALVCNIMASDVEMTQRGQWFYAQGTTILRQIYDWKNGFSQASIEAQSDTLTMTPGITKFSPLPKGPVTTGGSQSGAGG